MSSHRQLPVHVLPTSSSHRLGGLSTSIVPIVQMMKLRPKNFTWFVLKVLLQLNTQKTDSGLKLAKSCAQLGLSAGTTLPVGRDSHIMATGHEEGTFQEGAGGKL